MPDGRRLIDQQVTADGSTGVVVEEQVPSDELWYVDEIFFVVGTPTTDDVFSYAVETSVGVTPERIASGSSPTDGSTRVITKGGENTSAVSDPVGTLVTIDGQGPGTTTVGAYLYPNEGVVVEETTDDVSNGTYRVVLLGRRVLP